MPLIFLTFANRVHVITFKTDRQSTHRITRLMQNTVSYHHLRADKKHSKITSCHTDRITNMPQDLIPSILTRTLRFHYLYTDKHTFRQLQKEGQSTSNSSAKFHRICTVKKHDRLYRLLTDKEDFERTVDERTRRRVVCLLKAYSPANRTVSPQGFPEV